MTLQGTATESDDPTTSYMLQVIFLFLFFKICFLIVVCGHLCNLVGIPLIRFISVNAFRRPGPDSASV